jgi:hypothetical protein
VFVLIREGHLLSCHLTLFQHERAALSPAAIWPAHFPGCYSDLLRQTQRQTQGAAASVARRNQVGTRVDSLVARAHGDVALFAHGHALASLSSVGSGCPARR